MARTVPARWLAQLRAVSNQHADLRFNEEVGRWEFRLLGADGQMQSQFYGWFHHPVTGVRLQSDPVTGLLPFRELDDAGMREVCRNLTETAIWNPHDGRGTTLKTVMERVRYNRDLKDRLRAKRVARLTEMLGEVRWREAAVAVPTTYGGADAVQSAGPQ